MFSYYSRMALISMKRNPMLTLLMVLCIAVGIGASTTTVTVNYTMSADPIPEKSRSLYHVQLDNWSPDETFYRSEPDSLPDQLTWIDAINLLKAKRATRQVVMTSSEVIVEPDSQDIQSFRASARLASSSFFSMFNAPFLYGSGWEESSDLSREQVVVISRNLNERLFGGENSVGKTLKLERQNFRILGVLDNWRPLPRFFDVTTDPFGEVEQLVLPIGLKESMELPYKGNVGCWKDPEGEGFSAFLNSECVFNQMWVELPGSSDVSNYQAFLDNYISEQKEYGRFPRPLKSQLMDVMTWLDYQRVVARDAKIMLWLSAMFLAVCLLNTIGLLMAKLATKSKEINIRKSLGASQTDLFYQFTVETGFVGFFGGLMGLLFAYVSLQQVKHLYGSFGSASITLDFPMIALAMITALLASILAGLYPTWLAAKKVAA